VGRKSAPFPPASEARAHVIADLDPGGSIIQRCPHRVVGTRVEKPGPGWILGHNMGEGVGRTLDSAVDAGPALAVVPGPVDVRLEVCELVRVHGDVGGALGMPGGSDASDAPETRDTRDVIPDLRPTLAPVPGDVKPTVVGPGPKKPLSQRRFGQGVEHRAVVGHEVVMGHPAGGLLVLFQVPGEVRADDVPALPSVPAPMNVLASGFDGNQHASEVTGGEVTLFLAHALLSRYGSDPEITRLVDTRVTYIVQRADPDGEWKTYSPDPRIMVQREEGDTAGLFYRVIDEGLDDDGDGLVNEGYLDTSMEQARRARVAEPDRVIIELGEGATTSDPLSVEFPFMRGTRESSSVIAYRASWNIEAPEGARVTIVLRSEKGGVDRREIQLRSVTPDLS